MNANTMNALKNLFEPSPRICSVHFCSVQVRLERGRMKSGGGDTAVAAGKVAPKHPTASDRCLGVSDGFLLGFARRKAVIQVSDY